MLVVSSIQFASMVLTQVGIVDTGQYEVDSFNDHTDGQFRRLSSVGEPHFGSQEAISSPS